MQSLFFRKSSKYWNDVYDTWYHYFGIDWNLYFVKQIKKNITVNLEIFQHMRYWRMLTAMVSLLAQSMLGKLSQMEHEKADKEMMSILVLHCIKG